MIFFYGIIIIIPGIVQFQGRVFSVWNSVGSLHDREKVCNIKCSKSYKAIFPSLSLTEVQIVKVEWKVDSIRDLSGQCWQLYRRLPTFRELCWPQLSGWHWRYEKNHVCFLVLFIFAVTFTWFILTLMRLKSTYLMLKPNLTFNRVKPS